MISASPGSAGWHITGPNDVMPATPLGEDFGEGRIRFANSHGRSCIISPSVDGGD